MAKVMGGPAALMLDNDRAQVRNSGIRSLTLEIAGIEALRDALSGALGPTFDVAVERIRRAKGRIIVSGMGKSGHIARKIAATFASTGTPAFFVHPAEASHGDLGMVTADDVILALSWSGETAELSDLIHFSRRYAVTLVAMTSRPDSSLARAADVPLILPRSEEACPHGLAPTTSTVMQLALGDALAMALLESRGFTSGDFRQFHPGGKLGARLLAVRDLMHRDDEVPLITSRATMSEALIAIASKRFGCVGVVEADGTMAGIVTDGDLRRHMSHDLLAQKIDDVMTRTPITVAPDFLASSALELMNREQITTVFVMSDDRPVGILHIHDLLRGGVA